ncbi:MAG: hypothetical protein ACE366_14430 [Bradymonadia bacterium]
MSTYLTPWRGALLCCVVVLGAIWGRCIVEGNAELEKALAAESRGDWPLARRHGLYAMGWYAPGASAAHEAAECVWRVSDAALARGDEATALAAADDVRAGALSTRSVLDPLGEWLPRANDRIATLRARQHAALPSARGRTEPELRAHHLSLLERDLTPSSAMSLLVMLSCLGWILGLAAWSRWGITAEGRLVPRKGIRLIGGTVALFAVWLWALSVA